MQPMRIPKLADNIALVRNVCLFRAQSLRTTTGRRGRNASVVAHVWADERSGSLGTLRGAGGRLGFLAVGAAGRWPQHARGRPCALALGPSKKGLARTNSSEERTVEL